MTDHDPKGAPEGRGSESLLRRVRLRLPRLGLPKLAAPPRLRLRLSSMRPAAVYVLLALMGLVFLVIFTAPPREDEPQLTVDVSDPAGQPVGGPVTRDVPPAATEVVGPDFPPVPAGEPEEVPGAVAETPETELAGVAEPGQAGPGEDSTPPPWVALDDDFLLGPAAVARFTTLPRPYAWPLPWAQSRVICHTNADAPHIHMLQSPDGRLYHWGEAARYVRQINDAHAIASTEVATVSPMAFLEPLRAAGQRLCATRLAAADVAESGEAPTPAYDPVNALPFELPVPPPAGGGGRSTRQ